MRAERGVIDPLYSCHSMGEAVADHEEVARGLVARGECGGVYCAFRNFEPVRALDLVGLQVPVPSHDPWAVKIADKGSYFMQKAHVVFRDAIGVFEVHRNEI